MADTSRLPEAQRRALDRLKSVPRMADFYLAGGTAVAVHLGHRISLVFRTVNHVKIAMGVTLRRTHGQPRWCRRAAG